MCRWRARQCREGIRTTSATPGIDRAYLSSTESTLAPKWSGRRTTVDQLARSAHVERKFGRSGGLGDGIESWQALADDLPILWVLESDGGRHRNIGGVGGELAELSRTLGSRMRDNTFAIDISSTRTPHLDAAAVASMIRAAAPTLRICSQEWDSEVLPPVSMCGPNARLL